MKMSEQPLMYLLDCAFMINKDVFKSNVLKFQHRNSTSWNMYKE